MMVPAPQKSNAAPVGVAESLRILLSGLIDYAGMFPPAGLSLADAARNFVRYAQGSRAWMLGNLVVPAAQLGELRRCLHSLPEARGTQCGVSALLGAEPLRDAETIREALRQAESAGYLIKAVEFRPGSPAMLPEIAAALPSALPVFCEISPAEDLGAWLVAIRQAGWSAKIRTGGTTPESFPSSASVARFLMQCNLQGVAFKATAGLHHPVRSEHPLTYESKSVCGVMHGFLNVFLGAALLESGIAEDRLVEVLDDTHAASFRFTGRFAHWEKVSVNDEDISRTRRSFALSFGSCSFEEPIRDLEKLGIL